MLRQYPKDKKQMARLDELVTHITESLPFDIWAECLCRISEYLAAGQDSESALENTYGDMLDNSDIEGMDTLPDSEKEMLKTHLHFKMAQDYNPILFQ